MDACSIAFFIAATPKAGAETAFKLPLNEPIGVRAAPAMKTSGKLEVLSCRTDEALDCSVRENIMVDKMRLRT